MSRLFYKSSVVTITLRALQEDDLDDLFRWESDPRAAIEEDGVLTGMIASFTVEGDRELTYWIDPVRWGRGIASGAVEMFIRRETQRPLFARVATHNLGSSKVLLRNGFMKIGEETSWVDGVGADVLEHIYRLD